MKIVELKCPACSSALKVDANLNACFCQYCGTRIIIDHEESITRHIDEAEIKKAEVEREVRLRELELEEKRIADAKSVGAIQKIAIIAWAVLMCILFFITVGLWLFSEMGFIEGFVFAFYAGMPIAVGSSFVVFKLIPSKLRR